MINYRKKSGIAKVDAVIIMGLYLIIYFSTKQKRESTVDMQFN